MMMIMMMIIKCKFIDGLMPVKSFFPSLFLIRSLNSCCDM